MNFPRFGHHQDALRTKAWHKTHLSMLYDELAAEPSSCILLRSVLLLPSRRLGPPVDAAVPLPAELDQPAVRARLQAFGLPAEEATGLLGIIRLHITTRVFSLSRITAAKRGCVRENAVNFPRIVQTVGMCSSGKGKEDGKI